MATPKYAERVAVLETKFDILKETVETGFRELGEKIDAASLNGQTPRVKALATRLGDPEDVEMLAAIVESRKRSAWLSAPFKSARGGVLNALLWFGTAGVLAALHAWLHATFSAIP